MPRHCERVPDVRLLQHGFFAATTATATSLQTTFHNRLRKAVIPTIDFIMKLLVSVVAFLFVSTASAFAPAPVIVNRNAVATRMASAATEDYYIDDERRLVMNLLMVGAGGLTVVGFGLPFILFFFPPGSGGGTGGIPAKDALGNDLLAKEYLATKPANDRSLAQGLKGDAT